MAGEVCGLTRREVEMLRKVVEKELRHYRQFYDMFLAGFACERPGYEKYRNFAILKEKLDGIRELFKAEVV